MSRSYDWWLKVLLRGLEIRVKVHHRLVPCLLFINADLFRTNHRDVSSFSNHPLPRLVCPVKQICIWYQTADLFESSYQNHNIQMRAVAPIHLISLSISVIKWKYHLLSSGISQKTLNNCIIKGTLTRLNCSWD